MVCQNAVKQHIKSGNYLKLRLSDLTCIYSDSSKLIQAVRAASSAPAVSARFELGRCLAAGRDSYALKETTGL